ncbi:MAG: ATP-dependent Clp protease ATP-binding subunit [Clostridiales bacterium]|nr:ATP-dependent Clp protease ATP-binding subunit [Clostridiales bacterium]
MPLCSVCKKRQAIVFTSRYENGRRIDDGFCMKCAYESGFAGISDMFAAAGINGDNIDEMADRVENIIGKTGNATNPTDFLKAITGEEFGEFGGIDDPDMSYDSNDEYSFIDDDQNNVGVADIGNGDSDIPPEDSFGTRPGNSVDAGNNPISSFMDSLFGRGRESSEETGDGTGNRKKDSREKGGKRRLKFLNEFGTNLTERAKEGKIDRILGRDKEIDRVVQILNRRTKNNPVLIGEPGVGKTAIAQGLANKIVEGSVPDKLQDMQIWQLDLAAMVAGTQFRGMFENRIKGVINEAIREENIILVIDELHTIVGAGDSEGSTNAANILKPALARGELRIIGSTTTAEYKKIEKDSALERRFQRVVVDEPSEEVSVDILMGIKDYYEKHHNVEYSPEVIRFAVQASKRYITDRYLPDKAIDLIDEAGSRANLDNVKLVKLKKTEELLDKTNKEYSAMVEKMESLTMSEREQYYAKVAELRAQSEKAQQEYDTLKDDIKPDPISVEDIAKVVEMWTGIPCKSISESETQKLIHLEERLHERVVGQDKAVDAVAQAVRRNRSGFTKKHKPASFIFVGPTGVGKTELVKALTEVMFGTEDALIRIDMSEYMEPHSVSKLIGSPPGYVGHEDSGQLTEQVRHKPYCVILFDEIEKAHADVFNLLLQMLDEGRLTDSHGVHVNFENAIIIMTSNAGNTAKAPTIGFFSGTQEAIESTVSSALKETFRPEFLNRVDETIIFSELKPEEIRQIVDIMMKEVFSVLSDKGITGSITDRAADRLAKIGYDPKYGARPLRKAIRKQIEDKLSDMTLDGSLKDVADIVIDYNEGDDGMTFITTKKKTRQRKASASNK